MQSSSTVLFFLQEFTECPGSDKLQTLLENLLEENAVEGSGFPHIDQHLKPL
jgi:hypothetical protein